MKQILPVLLSLGLLGCQDGDSATILQKVEPVDHPGYSAMEEVVRSQLLALREPLDAQLSSPDSESQLAIAFGALGEAYHAYGLSEAASDCYRNAHRLDPQSFAWAYLLGMAEREAGSPQAALDAFRSALELRPDSSIARFRLAMLGLDSGQPAQARAHLESLAADQGFEAAAALGLARLHIAEQNPEKAIVLLEEALGHQPGLKDASHLLDLWEEKLGFEPNDQLSRGELPLIVPDRLSTRIESLAKGSGSYLRRANQALLSNQLEDAVAAYRKAVELAPENAEVRRSLAHALARQGEPQAALSELESAIEIDPENAWLHFDLGTTSASAGLDSQAIAAFERTVELAPNLVRARFNLANSYAEAERWQEAGAQLAVLEELGADDQRSRYLAAIAVHKGGASDRALELLRSEQESDPSSELILEGIAMVLTETGKRPEAIALYRTAAMGSGSPEARARWCSLWASLEWRQRKPDNALRAWRLAVELVPDSAGARLELANGLQLVGRHEEATSEFETATELDPSNPTAWLSEGRLRILSSDFERAKARLLQAVKAHPNHAGLSATLARLLSTCPLPSVRDGQLAVLLARRAHALEPTIEHSETVGMALAENGLFEEAIEWQQGLLRQATIGGLQKDAQRLIANLRLYQQRQPVRFQG